MGGCSPRISAVEWSGVEWWRTKPGIPTQNSVQQNLQKEAAAAVTQKHNAGQQGTVWGNCP